MKRTFTLLLLLSAITCAAQSLTIDGPRVVSIDETFRIVFSADGNMDGFDWPGTEDFDVVWGPQRGSSSSTSIINGKRTSSHQETMTYILQPKAEGKFTIPGATATVEKTECSSKSLTIEVVGSQQQSQQQNQQQNSGQQQSSGNQNSAGNAAATGTVSNQDIFMRLSVSKTDVVKGEPITATLKIYTRADISGFEDIHFPTFNGFWSKETVAVNNLEFNRENVGGTIYNSALLRQYMLIPQQTGKLTIDPAEMVCQVRIRTSSGSPMSIFDDFFDSFQTIRKRISTPAVTINVRDLPQGAPASFAGGVGDFKIAARMSKEGIKSNEAASLTVTVSGKGNIAMIEAPEVSFPPDFEVYDLKTTDKVSNDGTSGSKSFEFPFIPRSHGDFTIPSIEYSYYDNAHGKYVTVSTGDIPVTIEKGEEIEGGGVAVAGSNRQAVRSLAEDFRYISTGNGGLKKKDSFFAGSPLFFILLAAVALLYFSILAAMRASARRKADVAGSRNRKANKVARARLKNAEGYMKQGLSSAYYEELHKALLGYISDKLAIPAADLSRETVTSTLESRGASGAVIASFNSLLDRCEFARYSPESGQAQMQNEYDEAVGTISELERQVKGTMKNGTPKTALIALLLLCTGLSAMAQEQSVSDLWKKAGEAYAAEQWQNALTLYQAIEAENLQSADLYYNIGNAFYRTGDIARSILYYEKALKLEPGHEDAANNLAIVSQMTLDKIDVVPDFILASWMNNLRRGISADGWAWITLALAAAVAALMLVFRLSEREGLRKVSFIVACVLTAMMAVALVFSLKQRREITESESAIVTSPVSSVKNSPADGGQTVFVIHEGTKVRLIDSVGDWTRISLSDGRQGWLKAETIEEI